MEALPSVKGVLSTMTVVTSALAPPRLRIQPGLAQLMTGRVKLWLGMMGPLTFLLRS